MRTQAENLLFSIRSILIYLNQEWAMKKNYDNKNSLKYINMKWKPTLSFYTTNLSKLDQWVISPGPIGDMFMNRPMWTGIYHTKVRPTDLRKMRALPEREGDDLLRRDHFKSKSVIKVARIYNYIYIYIFFFNYHLKLLPRSRILFFSNCKQGQKIHVPLQLRRRKTKWNQPSHWRTDTLF